jgi:hypothetical protein
MESSRPRAAEGVEVKASDGGPAFPGEVLEREGTFGSKERVLKSGMSLRDWFAGQAMIGLLSGRHGAESFAPAKLSYKIAEAMLLERARLAAEDEAK